MGTALIVAEDVIPFIWREPDEKGRYRLITLIETKDLLGIACILWNRHCSFNERVNDVIKLPFRDFYTINYLNKAYIHVCAELVVREDLPRKWEAFVSKIYQDSLRKMEHLI